MGKTDLKKVLVGLYAAPEEPAFVDVPPVSYLAADGSGDPRGSTRFEAVVGALYGLAYGIKMAHKRDSPGEDWTVMPLEGLWWCDDIGTFSLERRGDWLWTLQIAQPALVTMTMLEAARAALAKKKANPVVAEVRLETMHEGRAAHLMHRGPYADEAPTIARLHAFIRENKLAPRGKHREIYLSDPARTAPEKMKTIIRQPVG